MPGFHAALFEPAEGRALWAAAMQEQRQDPLLQTEGLWQDDGHAVAFSGHSAYPRQVWEGDGVHILLEGAVYDLPVRDVEAQLREIAAALKAGTDVDSLVRSFIDSRDGDFLVVIHVDGRRDMAVFNDRWARLPVFYRQGPFGAVISRSLRFLLPWAPDVRFDSLALAEFLSLGHTLGARTLISSISRLLPGSLWRCREVDGRLCGEARQLVPPVFSEKKGIAPAEALDHCASHFLDSVSKRADWCRQTGWTLTADVTGGRDSRAIYVALARLGVAGLFMSDDMAGKSECEHLSELEALFGVPIQRIPQQEPAPDFEDMRRLTYYTDCGVNGWTTFRIEAKTRKRLERLSGSAVRFMGLGAHVIKTLPRVPFLYRTIGKMVRDGVLFPMLTIQETSRLLSLPRGCLSSHVQGYFEAFGDSSLAQVLKRNYLEYETKLVAAGEERQRRYFWTLAPYWSAKFYSYAMANLPTDMLDYGFFDRFLERIDPRATRVPFHRRPGEHVSLAGRLWQRLSLRMQILGKGWPLLKFRKKYKGWICGEYRRLRRPGELERQLLAAYDETPAARDYFSRRELERFASRRVAPVKKYQLLTVLQYMSEVGRRFTVAPPAESSHP